MPLTIDAAGRLVIPKALRDAAGIRPGTPLEAHFRDGRIEIEPSSIEVELVEAHGVLIARPVDEAPELDVEAVDATVNQLRSERG